MDGRRDRAELDQADADDDLGQPAGDLDEVRVRRDRGAALRSGWVAGGLIGGRGTAGRTRRWLGGLGLGTLVGAPPRGMPKRKPTMPPAKAAARATSRATATTRQPGGR